jgi:hypothetical protein
LITNVDVCKHLHTVFLPHERKGNMKTNDAGHTIPGSIPVLPTGNVRPVDIKTVGDPRYPGTVATPGQPQPAGAAKPAPADGVLTPEAATDPFTPLTPQGNLMTPAAAPPAVPAVGPHGRPLLPGEQIGAWHKGG